LTASVEMENTISGDRMGLRMAALDGDVWDNLMPSNHKPPYGMYSYSFSDLNNNDIGDDAPGTFEYAFDGRVISNPTLDTNTAELMPMGQNFGGSRAGFGAFDSVPYDNIVEIERALAATKMAAAYENDGKNLTNVIVTFPTKYRHISKEGFMCDNGDPDTLPNNICINGLGGVVVAGRPVPQDMGDVCASERTVAGGHAFGRADLYDGRWYYPPFRPETSGSVQYFLASYDDQERTTATPVVIDIFSGGRGQVSGPRAITDEVNYMFVNWPFSSGWFNLVLTVVPGCQYTGVPVLAYAHKTQVKDGAFVNSLLVPLTKDEAIDRN
jgi:hypothetical protein